MPCCIVFVLDTSGSMSTRAHANFSFLDIAKNFIESFIKGRNGRQNVGREGDRYYLITTSQKFPENVKVVNEKNPMPVLEEIRKIPYPTGITHVQNVIMDAFRVLHMNRTMTGIDSYGGGRPIQNTEQVAVILLTDGSGVATIPNDFKLQFDPPFLGSDMTKEAFRWDQKLYSVVFRIPSTPYKPTNSQLLTIDIDIPNIEKLCATTGGRSFSIVSARQIQTSIDHIQNMQMAHRVGVRFDCLNTISGKQTSEEVLKLRQKFKKILEKRPVTNLISRLSPQGRAVNCHWVIPEAYYPLKTMDALPQRQAHPMLHLATEAIPLQVRNDLPFDKLEVEPGPVVEILMEMLKGQKELAVPVFIANSSSNGGNTVPFGCLRLNTLGTGINLILMPFNFPILYALIEEAKDPLALTNPQWRSKLDNYLGTVPFYFWSTMRVALEKFKIKTDISSSMSSFYPATLLSSLNRLKMKGKDEFDAIAMSSKLAEAKGVPGVNTATPVERITTRSVIVGLSRPEDEEETEEGEIRANEIKPIVNNDVQIYLYPSLVNEPELDSSYRSPWSNSLEDLISKLHKMQANVEMIFDPDKPTLLDMAKVGVKARFNNLEELHNLPLKIMGEYEPYCTARVKHYGAALKKIEEEKERTHAFGNPYKLKTFGAGIDEVVDSSFVDAKREGKRDGFHHGGDRGGPPKRRRGPLGIDAFDKWRTKRSMSGSSASSVVMSDLDSDSATSSFVMANYEKKNGSEVEIMEIDELAGMLEKGARRSSEAEQENGGGNTQNGTNPTLPVPQRPPSMSTPNSTARLNKLSSEELTIKRMAIQAIVRRPANNRAFDEIITEMAGISKDCSVALLKHAIREAVRFRQKILRERLEHQLGVVGV